MKGAINKATKGLAPPATPEEEAEDAAREEEYRAEEESQAGKEPATPEEQEAYERAVLAGMDIIFDKSTSPGIVKMLQSGADNPAQAIAQATIMVIQILEEKSQGQLPEVIILDLADELGGNVMDLGAKQGLFKVDDNLKARVAQQMNTLLAEMYGADDEDAQEIVDGVSPEELNSINEQQSAIAGGA